MSVNASTGISCDDPDTSISIHISAMPCTDVIQRGFFILNDDLNKPFVEVIEYNVVAGLITMLHPVAGESVISAKLFRELYIPVS